MPFPSSRWWVVSHGAARPLTYLSESNALVKHGRSKFGVDWLAFQAIDEADAKHQAALYDTGNHPRQREIDLFAQAYRCGGVALPAEPDETPLVPRPLAPRTS